MKLLLTKALLFTFVTASAFSCGSMQSSEKLKQTVVLDYDVSASDEAQANPKAVYAQATVLGIQKLDSIDALIKNKKIGVFMNHTASYDGLMLHELLLKKGYYVTKIFTPEHGLKASADAGAKVNSKVDSKTGLPIKSLYGNSKKPTSADLRGLEVVIFDMQDVGCRFYTYISSLQYMMEACASNGVKLVVLDRPNPNGHYVDGPVLEPDYKSFVGMQRIPIVHGMTMGEYALMLVGERWIENADDLKLTIVPCSNYDHKKFYSIPVYPSPNLRTDNAIELYPALCLFEGTDVSVGRGTESPFEVFGSPSIKGLSYPYSFVPRSSFGASKPLHENQVCNGLDLHMNIYGKQRFHQIPLNYVIDAYHNYRSQGKQTQFFNNFFNKLAGNATLKEQIKSNMTEAQIRESWQKDLTKFKSIRKKYLLYADFDER